VITSTPQTHYSVREVSRVGYLFCFVSQSAFAIGVQETRNYPFPKHFTGQELVNYLYRLLLAHSAPTRNYFNVHGGRTVSVTHMDVVPPTKVYWRRKIGCVVNRGHLRKWWWPILRHSRETERTNERAVSLCYKTLRCVHYTNYGKKCQLIQLSSLNHGHGERHGVFRLTCCKPFSRP
jgi:hypothetical protein